MANPTYRKNRRDGVHGGNRALDLSYNDKAGALKTIGRVMGELTPKGDAATTKDCELGEMIAFYNDSASTVFVAFAQTAAAIPGSIDGTNGIAIPPRDYVVLSSGNNNKYKSSGACWSYSINDDTYLG